MRQQSSSAQSADPISTYESRRRGIAISDLRGVESLGLRIQIRHLRARNFKLNEGKTMNKLFRLLAICTINVAFATSSIAWAQSYTTVDYPGAIATSLYGSNPQGTYIGSWTDTGGVTHGFFLKRGAFTSFDAPGSTSTFPYGITPQGVIVGEYFDAGGAQHGFILTDGQYTTVDYPGAPGTFLDGMNPSGEIVGAYCVNSACNYFHSFILSKKGQFTSFDPPGATRSVAEAVNPSGTIVGNYNTASPPNLAHRHGYMLYQGRLATVDFPGTGNYGTFVGGINPQGDIVGFYADSSGVDHGFLLSNGVFTSFDYPGATYTAAAGINPAGIIVGEYGDSAGNPHGFIRTP